MKRIFTLSVIAAITLAFTGCYKNYGDVNGNENYWLTQERGEVVYSDVYCQYYIVETNYGYQVLYNFGGYKPYEGSVVYGNFSSYGTRDFYNRSSGRIFTADVRDYWLSYYEAQEAVYFYCR
jgi:hypothetical protein